MLKILLPVDGSECSARAVDHLTGHADWFGGSPEVHVLHVHLPIPIGRVQRHIGPATLDAYYREESEAIVAPAVARLAAAGIAATPHIHVGQPAEVIVRVARELGCGLVVMGTHGRGALPAIVLGSVASKVLHLAESPVLLVK